MTGAQRKLLNDLIACGGRFVWSSDINVARKLEKLGLITLEDNGTFGFVDGERYLATPTAKAATYRSVWEQLGVGARVEVRWHPTAAWSPARIINFSPGGTYVHVADEGSNCLTMTRSEVARDMRFPKKSVDS